ncbi:hypothetical protein [uncultured Roseibium sp.]|uniref:hypothetical protein n=1 Tax=uncultured Roseibium sp. TaxID=1936171 RepID=UPI00262F770A|nr:hypothetical protein [uncultured Roseibium sp.]
MTLREDLSAAGFLALGAFEPDTADNLPDLGAGKTTKVLLLIGSTGPSLWPAFSNSDEFSDGNPHPLDRYTKRELSRIAASHGCAPLFPFEGPPYYPFQQWALKCGGFSQSPLGVLAHQDFGPWTGFRAAFLSSQPIAGLDQNTTAGPCETCLDKPCLSACPVNAISVETGYNVPACKAHLETGSDMKCWSGCLARHACPFGSSHKPHPDTARFHMESFVGLAR